MRYENHNEYNREAERKRNYRYTMIAVLCVLLVAAIAVFTVRANPQWMARQPDQNINLTNDKTPGQADQGRDVVKPVPTVDSKDSQSDEKAKGQGAAKSSQFLLPVKDCTLGMGFSTDIPVYSKTLDQYAVHDGVDLEAPSDTPVFAAADGTVTKVYNDDKLGLTIELTHGDGLVTRYSDLSTDKMVEEGDVVKKGDVISGVGSTALFESLDPPHVHFEVWKDGTPVDPGQYVTLPAKQQ